MEVSRGEQALVSENPKYRAYVMPTEITRAPRRTRNL